jgi:DNA-binding transcriptional regulator GbsR (MarR family)
MKLTQLKLNFTESLSQISRFWGYPRGMGAIFAVLYLSPVPLPLDELVRQTGLTKGAISTEVRTLARMGLVRRSTRLGDRRDYYEAEVDFYKSIRSILLERRNSEFDQALRVVSDSLEQLRRGRVQGQGPEVRFVKERLAALQEFFDAIDRLTQAVIRLDELGLPVVHKILGALK